MAPVKISHFLFIHLFSWSKRNCCNFCVETYGFVFKVLQAVNLTYLCSCHFVRRWKMLDWTCFPCTYLILISGLVTENILNFFLGRQNKKEGETIHNLMDNSTIFNRKDSFYLSSPFVGCLHKYWARSVLNYDYDLSWCDRTFSPIVSHMIAHVTKKQPSEYLDHEDDFSCCARGWMGRKSPNDFC